MAVPVAETKYIRPPRWSTWHSLVKARPWLAHLDTKAQSYASIEIPRASMRAGAILLHADHR